MVKRTALARTAALGLLLAAVLAFALMQAREPLLNSWAELVAQPEPPTRQAGSAGAGPSFTAFEVRPSAWFEGETELFTSVLQGSQCDVLVVPFEAHGRSLDRPGRSLISRMIAADIAARTGLCVADPTLVARAVGSQARRYDWPDIEPVANATGARVLIRGQISLGAAGQTFDLSVFAYRRETAAGPWGEPKTVNVDTTAFTDELAPEAAFAAQVSPLVGELELPVRQVQPADSDSVQAAHGLPPDPRRLALEPGSSIDHAQRLQLLAAMLSPNDTSSEHLWERSLVALTHLPPADAAAQVLRARASLHLHRRPYAVKLLGGFDTAEARALRALADGNLPEAEKRAAEVVNPVSALLTALEIEALRERYGSAATIGFESRRAALLARHDGYAALLYAPMSSGDWLHTDVHMLAARELARDGVLREDPQTLLERAAETVAGDSLEGISAVLAGEIEAGYGPLWRRNASDWRAARAFDRLAAWDVYDALYAANRAALARTFHTVRAKQGRPQTTVDLANRLGPQFRDYPPIEAEVALALHQIEQQAGTANPLKPSANVTARLRQVYAWEGGETPTSADVDDVLREPQEHFYSDEPPREWRPIPWNRGDRFDSTRLDPRRAATNAAHFVRATAYTQHEFWYLERAHEFMTQLGRKEDAARLVEQNRNRFIGHHLRNQFFAARARETADAATELALLEEAIRVQPNQWSGYYELARAQLRQRQPQLAQQTLLAYPQFHRQESHPVGLSNEAGDAGTLLHRAGEPELARPLLELSLGLRTGAAAEMWSGMRLAMTSGDYRAAIAWAGQLHDRYNSEWGLTDVAIFSFMLGAPDQGWRVFDQAAQSQTGAEPWLAAFTGHRIAGADDQSLVEFIRNWKRNSGPPYFEALLKEHFLFNMLMIDRPASEQSLRSVLAFGGKSGDRAFGILANGYDALRRGDNANAAKHFAQMHNVLVNVSVNAKRPGAYILPYMTLAHLRMGKLEEAQALVASARERMGTDFYTLMAQAFLDGHAGRAEQARTALWEAFLERPNAADLPVPPSFQILEACETLLELTGDEGYRVLLADLARRQARAWPFSWAFAFQAKYASDPDERLRALGIALFLDRRSQRLTGFSAAERIQATAWFGRHNPFIRAKPKLQTAAL